MDALKVESWNETEYSSPAAAMASVLDIVREYEVTLPGHICAVLVTVLVLEGWSSALKPDHSVLSLVRNLVSVDSTTFIDRLSKSINGWMEMAPILPSFDTC
jgi:aarF domain-containing kinase